LLPGVGELLRPLAARFAAVALVSGRPATYLAWPSIPPRPECATGPVRAAGNPRRSSRATRTGQRPHGRRGAAKRCQQPWLSATAAPTSWRTRRSRLPSIPVTSPTRPVGQSRRPRRPRAWAWLGSNQRLLPCEGSTAVTHPSPPPCSATHDRRSAAWAAEASWCCAGLGEAWLLATFWQALCQPHLAKRPPCSQSNRSANL
jgi:hypothetical protein